FKGAGTIHLAGREPAYDVTGKLSGLAWRNGAIGAEGVLSTSGAGAALLSNMEAQGTFNGRGIEFAPAEAWDAISGTFDWGADARSPRLRLPHLVMKSGAETYLGSAEMDERGQLVLKVGDGIRHIQAAGAILKGEALKPLP
ncbi:MAG: hypothetical protein M3N93_05140, partial [Acidobacteriota bacterium]|nr:hypothetical protein [Acidobacteriota bacterium]